jgi:hypothetical protein
MNPFRKAFMSQHPKLTSKQVMDAVIKIGMELDGSLSRLIQGRPVSAVFDGGKDVCGRKLLGCCIIIGGKCLFYELLDTRQEVLDTSYYKAYCCRIANELGSKGAILLSFTLDNEASQNAGLREAIEAEIKWVLHMR